MNKTFLTDKFYFLAKLGFIVLMAIKFRDQVMMLVHTTCDGTSQLLLSFNAIIVMFLVFGIRDLLKRVPVKEGIDGLVQWALLMWIIPMLAAASLHGLIGPVIGNEVVTEKGLQGGAITLALAYVMVLIVSAFHSGVPLLESVAKGVWNRVPEKV